ncbi:MAG: hypothetical protein OHK0040_04210 [bacterium]
MANGKILIIDDELFFLDMLAEILIKKGYEVIKGNTLEEGIDFLKQGRVDVIFLDASLKNVGGTSGISKIREIEKDTDIVVITSLDDASLASQFLKDGATDFVLKPYKTEELELVIDKILKRKDIEKEREILLYENIEFIELLSLYRRIVKLLTIWEHDRLKDALLDEIMQCTFGQGAIYYSLANEEDKFYTCELYKGIVDATEAKRHVPKDIFENADLSYYIKPRELNIPLKLDEKSYGFVKVVEPFLQEGFSEKEFNKAYLVCEFVSYALENAKRLELLQRCAVKDEKTQAYYWDILKDFVRKEINKSLRYDRKLSVIGINIENIIDLRKNYGERAVKEAVVEFSTTVNSVIRDSDWFVERRDGEHLIFLTETDYFGAIMTIRRIRQALVGKGLIKGSRDVGELLINMAAVGLPTHGTTLEDLLKVLKARLMISRNSLYHKLDFNKNNFTHICDDIFKVGEAAQWKGDGIYYWTEGGEKHFFELLSLFFKDVKINAKRRGVLYSGVFDGAKFNLIEEKQGFSDLSTKLYLFFSENKESFELPGIVSVGIKDKSEKLNFLLYLNEHYSFLSLYKEGRYFESSDALLVEALINKLQIEYYLQWQL